MSINRQVNKENKVKICNEMLFRLKKEIPTHATTQMNVDDIMLK